jgi:SAM-dependent methyltransferase
VTGARYDSVADFYASGWPDSYLDPVSLAFFDLLGPVGGLRILDVACGHGRITRELARRGAHVVGVDVSEALIEKALATDEQEPLDVRYVHADIASEWLSEDGIFDAVTCSFGLSDIDDLDGCIDAAARALRPGGRFVFSLLHPCFAGCEEVSGAWPTASTYYDEGWWTADGPLSTLRRDVGANHRMLSTYLNVLTARGLRLDALSEPSPPQEWRDRQLVAARYPVFLVGRCLNDRRSPGP